MCIRLPHSCFVHIPRTGGLWFHEIVRTLNIKCQILKGDIDSHFAWHELPVNWRKLHGFSFIRHPLQWVASRWSHALSIDAVTDYRHYGIHREFDECVCLSFGGTLEFILKHSPGIVGRTYNFMTGGVSTLIRTDDLNRKIPHLLCELEGVDIVTARSVGTRIQRNNSTSSLDKYQRDIANTDQKLIEKFIVSEQIAMSMWESAK